MRYIASLLLLCAAFGNYAAAQTAPTLVFTPVLTTGLDEPLDIVRPAQDTARLFIVEKTGRVKIYKNGALNTDTFLKVSNLISTGGEQGLLSLVFHPDYATNRYFWILYTNTAGNLTLARYRTSASNPDVADANSAAIVLTVAHPTNTNHNGGKIIFGQDGFLYWSTGDGGAGGDPSNNAQNLNVRLGKMLRLNVNLNASAPYYTAPQSNPFVGTADSLVYQFGLRNPYRWSFDRLNGDMWIADVGQGAWEEVNRTTFATAAGRDWGWRCREGAHVYSTNTVCSTGFTDPVFEYDHSSQGGLSITGGYVYRGSLYPNLYGRYICVDYVRANGWTVAPNGSGGYVGTLQQGIPTEIAGFGEDHRGELYAAGLNGRLYRISATGGQPLPNSVSSTPVMPRTVRIHPVPTERGGTLTVEGVDRIGLYDLAGRSLPVQTRTDADGVVKAQMEVPAGVYLLRSWAGSEVYNERIVVQ